MVFINFNFLLYQVSIYRTLDQVSIYRTLDHSFHVAERVERKVEVSQRRQSMHVLPEKGKKKEKELFAIESHYTG